MKSSAPSKLTRLLSVAALACAGTITPLQVQANDWIGTTGWWNDPANWNGGVPDNSGGWAIGNVQNGGTAIVSNVVPNVSEAWAGNLGGAGTILVTNGGVLTVNNWLVVARMCCPSPTPTPLSDLIVHNGIVNKGGDGFIIGDAGGGLGGMGRITLAGTGQVNVTGGWFSLGVGEGSAWGYFRDNSVYTSSGQDFNVADTGIARGVCHISDNATVNISRFFLAKGDNTVGAIYQTGGTLNGAGGNANEWCIGGEDNGDANTHGYYNLSGGTFSNPFNLHIGRWGKGLFYQTGGTVILGSWSAVGREFNGVGVVYITGGTFSHTNTGPALMIAEQPSRGEMTLAGTGTVDTAGRLVIGNGGNGQFNLNGGTLRVPQIVRWNGSGYLNFNGGTLQAKAIEPAFMAGLTEAVVFSGSAIIDTAGNDIGIEQALLAPTGDGVQNIPITDGGSGYLTPPVVQVDPSGLGSGASAVAQINPDTGVLTNIVVTGSGYGYGFAPVVNLVGGGTATPATLGTPTLAAVSSGGLIKNGSGTLTLSGANTYSGPTAINAGKLVTTTAAIGGGAYSVANGAGLSVIVHLGNAQLNQSSLTLNTSSLDVDLGNFGNPTLAPLNVTGALAVNGTVTVNIADALPQLGQFPLVDYSSRVGSGSFVIGSLPLGVSASIVTNSVNGSIDLNITAVAAPRWEGNVSGVWDIGTTPNWIEISTSASAVYNEGNSVLFNDQATGTTAVSLGVTVNPAKVTVVNTNLAYSIGGNGRIAGATGLLKQGPGSLALHTTNDYTGVTRIEGGTVAVTNLANGGVASSIGRASASPQNLVLAGGSLSYAGPAITIDRGYSVAGPNSGFNLSGDLTLSGNVTASTGGGSVKSGPARLTYAGPGVRQLSGGAFPGYRVENGTLLFDGSAGGQTNNSQNEFWVGNTIDQGAHIILSNTVLNVDSWFAVGRGNGTVGNVSTATLYNSRLRSGNFSSGWDNNIFGNSSSQTITLNGSSSITNLADMNLGESGGSTSTILLNDTSVIFSDSRIHLGWHNGGVGILTMANSSVMNVDAWFSIGHEGGTGTLTVKDSAKLRVLWDMNVTDVGLGSGTMTVQDSAVVEWGSLFVGKGEGSVGILNQTGGSMLATEFREAHIGFRGQGTFNLSAGSCVAPTHWFIVGRHGTGPGEFNVSGTGSFVHGTGDAGRLFRVGEEGTGVLNVSGSGSFVSAGNAVTLGNTGAGNGTINLNGGSLQARQILSGPGFGTLNFNGGVLRAGPNPNADFINAATVANVLAGGAIIDTGTNRVAVNAALADGTGGGGLTKQGTGALYLNGANAYTGTTLVSAGTLGGNGVISGPVSVAAGASLSPGTSIGTLTINNTLTLAGTSTTVIEVDKNANLSDLVSGVTTLTYGGTLVLKNLGGMLQVGDTFNVFDATTFSGTFANVVSQTPGQTVTWNTSQLGVNGTVSVSSAVANPATITSVVSGGNLNLSWPASQLGYRLEVQTNPLSVGLSNNWVTVPGSTEVTSVSVPISATTPTAFYRLVFP